MSNRKKRHEEEFRNRQYAFARMPDGTLHRICDKQDIRLRYPTAKLEMRSCPYIGCQGDIAAFPPCPRCY